MRKEKSGTGRFSEFCIYTIRKKADLEAAAKKPRITFEENKRWVAGNDLFELSEQAGKKMAELFSDAAHDTSRLIYWGTLSKVVVKDDEHRTRFTVENLRRIQGSRSTQELILRSTGRGISPNHIRPYCICHTPDFVR